MLTTQMLRAPIPIMVAEHSKNHVGVGRLLSAAVVNRQFRDLLLSNPQAALRNGYQGESFSLSHDERNLVVSIRADTLTDFAGQIARALYV